MKYFFYAPATALAVLAQAPAQAAPTYDTIIRGGTVIDGSGSAAFKGDVAIKDGHIAAVGDLKDVQAQNIVDATGLMVTPGFINIHSHAEADALPTAVNVLTQGVTTEIINSDGHGTTDITGQLAEYAAKGMAENIGAYIGFNAIWAATVGLEDRRATPAEIGRMRSLVEQNLQRGAWGVSAGLDYKPGYFAQADEVVKVVSVAKPWRTNFPNHDRLRPEENFSSFKGMAETISIGERAGLVPVITHMKSQGIEQGNAPAVIKLMSDADSRGTYTASDIYPYLAGQSGLSALLLPAWALEGGRPAMLARFKDPVKRSEIIAAAENAMKLRFGGPSGVYVLNTGQELTQVMSELGVGAGEAVIRLLEREDMGAILRFGAEEDLRAFLRYPNTVIACDCGATLREKIHPRQYGAFPRVLGRYVRENGTLTWEDAVRKMTALPATVIGSIDRGYLAPGMVADIAVFDPETVVDHATYEAPTKPSDGVRHVFVNGKPAVTDGKPTGAKHGTTLRRAAHMPSRPMTPAGEISVSGMVNNKEVQMSLAAAQGRGDRLAHGHLQLLDMRDGTVWNAHHLGLIQTAPGWVSLTATLQDYRGNLRPVTVTFDSLDGKQVKPAAFVEFGGSAPLTAEPAGTVRVSSR